MPGRSLITGEETKEKFVGKELDTETGWFHFGARPYMAHLGRWPVVDPLAHKYPSLSPYTYAANNPVRNIDMDGRDVVILQRKENRLLINIVNETYRKSPTFRKIYNTLRAKRNVQVGLRLKGGPRERKFRARTSILQTKPVKQILSEIGAFESFKGVVTGHELQHAIELSDEKIQSNEQFKELIEKGKIPGSVKGNHIETKEAQRIEGLIFKELQNDADDLDLPEGIDVTKQTYIDETHPPEEQKNKDEQKK